MTPPPQFYEDVLSAARGLRTFSDSIIQTHSFGHGPGRAGKLWTTGFHERALSIYTNTLPDSYLVTIATDFRDTGREMAQHGPPPGGDLHDWLIVGDFLRSMSDVVLAAPQVNGSIDPKYRQIKWPPAVLRYELLAALISADGAAQLRYASGWTVSALVRILPDHNDRDYQRPYMWR